MPLVALETTTTCPKYLRLSEGEKAIVISFEVFGAKVKNDSYTKKPSGVVILVTIRSALPRLETVRGFSSGTPTSTSPKNIFPLTLIIGFLTIGG